MDQDNTTLLTTAFRDPDGSIVVVVMNSTDKDLPFFLWCAGQAASTSSPAHSIQTLVF